MPVKIEVSNDGQTWLPDPGPHEVAQFKYMRTNPRAEPRAVAVRGEWGCTPIDRSGWPFGAVASLYSDEALWSSCEGPDRGWSIVRSNEDVHQWIQIRPKGEAWNGSAWVSEGAPKPGPRFVRQHSDDEKTWTTCDCHETDPMRPACRKPVRRELRDERVISVDFEDASYGRWRKVFDSPLDPDRPWREQMSKPEPKPDQHTYTINIDQPYAMSGAFARKIVDDLRRYIDQSAAAAMAPKPFGLADLVRSPPRWSPIDTWAPKVSPIAETLCGCGKHKIDPDGDRYAQHNAWSSGWTNGRDHSPEARWPTDNATRGAGGIGISARVPEPLAIQDMTGDDIAPDAPTALDYLRRR